MTAAHLWAMTRPSEPPLDPRPPRHGLFVALLAAWVLSIVLGLGVLLSGCSSPETEARRKPVQRKVPRRPTCAGPDFGGDPPPSVREGLRLFARAVLS
jgi:hypothetical protein